MYIAIVTQRSDNFSTAPRESVNGLADHSRVVIRTIDDNGGVTEREVFRGENFDEAVWEEQMKER